MKKIVLLILVIIVAFVGYKACHRSSGVIVNNTLHANMQVIDEPEKAPDAAMIYIDASGSMKGYFISSEPDFNNVMGALWGYAKQQRLYFIGQDTPYNGLIANLLSNLKAQPNNAASPLDRLIPELCKKTGSSNICFLVTDGIQSIGGNMQLALEQYKQRLKISLSRYAANKAVAVLKYSAEFKSDPGKSIYYYDMHNARKNVYARKRPFYVIAIGDKAVIRNLKNNASEMLHPEEQIYFGIHDYKGHDANQQQEDSTSRLENTGKAITMSATLPKCLRDYEDNYIRENTMVLQNGMKKTADVRYSNGNLLVEVNPTAAPAMSPAPDGFVSYYIKIKNTVPFSWERLSSVDDSNIERNLSETNRTFSLKYLLEGIKDALDPEAYIIELKYKFKY